MVENVALSEIMTSPVISLSPDDTVERVDHLFRANNIHHLPVIDADHKVVGIVSKGDYLLLCERFTLFRPEKELENNQLFFRTLLVSEVMTTQVATLRPSDTVIFAAGFFRENLFHAIPIVNEQKQLVGIVTTYDLLQYAYR